MKNIITIAKRELLSFLNTPTAYIVTVAFLAPGYFLFWRQTVLSNEASLRGFFSLLPWFLLLLIPAITMKTMADEQRKNTLELLLSHALQEWHIIIGKFLGTFAFYLLILATTLSLPITLMQWSNPDLGIITGQYFGAIFIGSAMIAMGILISTWFTQATTSFLVAAGVNFAWIILGLDIVTLALPWPFNQIAHQLAFLTHADQLARGLIEIRDVSYFITATAVLLTFASIRLAQAKLIENKAKQTKLYTGAILIAAIGIVIHLMLTNWPFRLDLTANQRFTLSEGTKTTITNLPDIVTITFYISKNLPGPVQLVRQDIEDTLKDYSRYGGNNLKITTLNPDTDTRIAQQAGQAGIQQIQFNTIASGKFSIENGYLGLVIRYGDQTEVIPYVQNSGTLEYDLTSRIRKLTVDDQPTIGFLSGLGAKSNLTELALWNQQIETQYKTTSVSLDTQESAVTADALIIAGPRENANESTASAKIKDYLNNQGKVLFLLDGVEANPQLGIASPVEHGWDSLLADYGLSIKSNLAYDVQLNENIRLGQGNVQYILPYPYWVRSLATETAKNQFSLQDGVLLGWPSSIDVNRDTENINITELLTTSQAGGITKGTLTIAPDTAPKQGQGTPVLLSVMAEKSGSRVVLVGDSELASDDFYQNSPANQLFLASILDWLVADNALTQIPRRQFVPTLLKFEKPQDALIAQYGNIIGVPVIIGLFGFWWLRRRNNLTKRTYRNTT